MASRVITLVTDGSGAASGVIGTVEGMLEGFHVDYGGAPGTTDITISVSGGDIQALTLLSKSNANTDGYFPIRANAVGTDLAAITGIYERLPVEGQVNVTVADGGAASTLVIKMFYEPGLC